MKGIPTIIIILLTVSAYAQDRDLNKRIKILEARLDSLERVIENKSISYKAEAPLITQYADTGKVEEDDLLQELTSIISFDETIQSSKKKRINDLLDALRSSDGILNFNGDATSIIQHNTGKYKYSSVTGSFDFFAFSQLGQFAKIFINLEGIGGNGPDSRLKTLAGLNGDAGSLQGKDGTDRIHVLEAWSEFSFFDNWLQVTAGKIDLTNYFDVNLIANDETTQFISNPFINSSALAVPLNSPGIRINVDLSNLLLFQLAVVSNDNSGDEIFRDLFKIVSTGLNIDFGENLGGFLHLYGYENSISDDANGFGLSGNFMIKNTFSFFFRWNRNSNNLARIHGIEKAWSGGLEFNGGIEDNSLKTGLAFGELNPYKVNLINEKLLELYISYKINEWVYLSPHLQIVWNSGGINSRNYRLAGLRTHFNF